MHVVEANFVPIRLSLFTRIDSDEIMAFPMESSKEKLIDYPKRNYVFRKIIESHLENLKYDELLEHIEQSPY